MNLIKFDPMMPRTFSNMFDNFFNRSISDFVGSDFVMNMPSVNVVETDNGYGLEVAAPGLAKEDFDISVEKDRLTISARKEAKEEVNEDKFTRREFNYASFQRSFYLPETIDKDAIEARYENGVLRLSLPKKAEIVKEEKGRTIEIG
ncbi:MAG: Hsp20/alpha crystallin family protein [Saprospiraceae bacterium]|nr:Hsp20/alpha crystallin family protein [Saprospiraceae bacterium]